MGERERREIPEKFQFEDDMEITLLAGLKRNFG